MLLVIQLSQCFISITPKLLENQSFLIISGVVEMENSLKIGKIHTNIVANLIKPMFHHFNTPHNIRKPEVFGNFGAYRNGVLT